MVVEDYRAAFDQSGKTMPSPSVQLFTDRSPATAVNDQRWPLSCHLGSLFAAPTRNGTHRQVCQCGLVLFGSAKQCRRCGRARVTTPGPSSELTSDDGDIAGLKDLARLSESGTEDLAGPDDAIEGDDPEKQLPTEDLLVMLGEIADGVTDCDDLSTSRSPLTTTVSSSTNGANPVLFAGARAAGTAAGSLAGLPPKPDESSQQKAMRTTHLHREVNTLQEQVQESMEAKVQLRSRLEGEVRELQERSARQYHEKDVLMQRLSSLKEGIAARLEQFTAEQKQLWDAIEAAHAANDQLRESMDVHVQQLLGQGNVLNARIQESSATQATLVEELQSAMERQAAAQAELQTERVSTHRLQNEVFVALSSLNAPPSAMAAIETAMSTTLSSREGRPGLAEMLKNHSNGEALTPRRGAVQWKKLTAGMDDSPSGASSSRASPSTADAASVKVIPSQALLSRPAATAEQGSLFRGVAQAAEQQDRERKECWRLGKQNCELSKELALEESAVHNFEMLLEETINKAKTTDIDLQETDHEVALKFYIDWGGVREIGYKAPVYVANAMATRRALNEAEDTCNRYADTKAEAVEWAKVEAQELEECEQQATHCRDMHEQRYTAWVEVQEEETRKRGELEALQVVLEDEKDAGAEMRSLQVQVREVEDSLKVYEEEKLRLRDMLDHSIGPFSCFRTRPRLPQSEAQSSPAAAAASAGPTRGKSPQSGKGRQPRPASPSASGGKGGKQNGTGSQSSSSGRASKGGGQPQKGSGKSSKGVSTLSAEGGHIGFGATALPEGRTMTG